MAVNRGIGDNDSFGFRRIRRPGLIKIQIIAKVLGKHRAVQGTDNLNIQPRRLFQQILNLYAVLAHNPNVIAASLARPILFYIQSAEFSKAIGRKQHLISTVIGNHDLRPVDHRSQHKGQIVLT